MTQKTTSLPTGHAGDSESVKSVEGEDPSSPPQRYYAAEEAICSTCGRHVDLCKHGQRKYNESDWV